jgi:hypothetical protein
MTAPVADDPETRVARLTRLAALDDARARRDLPGAIADRAHKQEAIKLERDERARLKAVADEKAAADAKRRNAATLDALRTAQWTKGQAIQALWVSERRVDFASVRDVVEIFRQIYPLSKDNGGDLWQDASDRAAWWIKYRIDEHGLDRARECRTRVNYHREVNLTFPEWLGLRAPTPTKRSAV